MILTEVKEGEIYGYWQSGKMYRIRVKKIFPRGTVGFRQARISGEWLDGISKGKTGRFSARDLRVIEEGS